MTTEILDTFESFRMPPTAIDQYNQVGKQILSDKIERFTITGKPIEFVMLGFPFKSINMRDKVIGTLPDYGEQLTMKNFALFNDEIKKVYPPGIKMSIASDGYMFNDILGVSDHTVSDYKLVSQEMASGSPVEIYDLKDFYSGHVDRDKAMEQFGITPEKLEAEILLNPDTNMLYRGMIHFVEQELAIKNFPSRNQLHKEAKKVTREMMMRNEAYSNLVRHNFANHIRLSMHPSVNNGNKYSFKLINSSKAWTSPWHSEILIGGAEVETIHRKDAESAGHKLVFQDGRPFYFTRNDQ